MSEALVARCSGVVAAGREALDWIHQTENAQYIGEDRLVLVDRNVRRNIRRADKLTRAAQSNMAVSVFGPSQNGKSFLVSVLARPKGGLLVANYDDPDGQLDYISKINPEGQGESTGLVTRFTMTRPVTPAGFPIPLTLLSEADILQTIANSFYEDGDNSELPLEGKQIEDHVARFAGSIDGPAQPGLTEDDVWEVADYIERNFFGSSSYAFNLKGFWADAARIAPKLSRAARAEFLSILWGGHEAFNALYAHLAGALDQIGHPELVYVGLDALLPRDTSIIDVAALRSLNHADEGRLKLQTPAGQTMDLKRSEVCALAAELVLPMRDEPDPMFAKTDLLDFPGARNRFEYTFAKELTKDAETRIPELLLRGKVAFLFDRYVENQAINAMLLCIKDSNMEATDLPGLVENWIAMTQGDTPERRARTACILFFVLTFFDVHLIDSAAAADDTTRFNKRIFMSLQEKFRKSDGWVDEWTQNKPFDNCYWVRNPNFWVEALFDYTRNPDGTVTEALKPEKAARIAELKEGCLSAPNVQQHFRDPDQAWDAAMAKDDGGVTYLVENLKAVCRPDSKAAQITEQMAIVQGALHTELTGFHIPSDVTQRRQQMEEAADTVIDGLEIALENRSFSSLIAALMVDQDVLMDRMTRVPSTVRIASGQAEPVATAAQAVSGATAIRPGGRTRPRAASRPPTEAATTTPAALDDGRPTIRTLSREAFQAEAAMTCWAERLDALKSDTALIRRLGLPEESVTILVGELQHASRLSGLRDTIAEEIAKLQFGLTLAAQAKPASLRAAEAINRFVTTLGYGGTPPESRPKVKLPYGERPVFAPRKQADTAMGLPEAPRPALVDFWTDWVHALDAMFAANAMEGQDDRGEQNARLGEILADLKQEGSTA